MKSRLQISRRVRLATLALSLGVLGAAFGPLARARQELDASATVSVADYLAGEVGSAWVFQQPGDAEPWILLLEQKSRILNGSTTRWAMSDGSYFVTSLDSSGLRLLESEDLAGHKRRFDNPEPMLPAEIEIGATYETAARYRELVDELPVAEGEVRAKVEVIGLRPVATAAGNFPDCLRLKLQLLQRTDDSGSGAGLEIELDLAPGLGPVYLKGESFRLAGDRREARSTLDRRLIEAQVGDRLLPATGTAQVRR